MPKNLLVGESPVASVLLVDDDKNHLNAMWRAFWLDGTHEAERFDDAGAALARARDKSFDVVISDYRMPSIDGIEFMKRFREIQSGGYCILISGYADMALFRAMRDAGVHRLLEKPCEGIQLLRAVQEGLEQVLAIREAQRLQQEMESIKRDYEALLARVLEKAPEILR